MKLMTFEDMANARYEDKDLYTYKEGTLHRKNNRLTKDMLEYKRSWYNKNFKNKKVKAQCECGEWFAYHYIAQHRKSAKHIKIIKDREREVRKERQLRKEAK